MTEPEEKLEMKPPTHVLKLLDKDTGDHGTVGVAWERDGGHLSIKLQPGVVLSYESCKGKVLTLFKNKTKSEWAAWKNKQTTSEPEAG